MRTKQYQSAWQFTSESVTEGHPDKVCDQIADAIVDQVLRDDPRPARARAAVEVLMKGKLCVVAGELRTQAHVDVAQTARAVLARIGAEGLGAVAARSLVVVDALDSQSDEIARAVDADDGRPLGAGDQGLMFGYACDETPERLPLSFSVARSLTQRLTQVRRDGAAWLRPDGKSQVTVHYEGARPVAIGTVVLSAQHAADLSLDEVRERITAQVVTPVLESALVKALVNEHTRVLVNPAGTFVRGGPDADAGVTGRKLMVDTYGGVGRHGGGAFSGKDPSKVDRTGAYVARYVANHVVAAGLASRCEVQLAYVIGAPDPVSVHVETFGTSVVDAQRLCAAVRVVFPLAPGDAIAALKLLEPIYERTAARGAFGHAELPWERIDRVDALRKAVAA